jgi:hypothetical protein
MQISHTNIFRFIIILTFTLGLIAPQIQYAYAQNQEIAQADVNTNIEDEAECVLLTENVKSNKINIAYLFQNSFNEDDPLHFTIENEISSFTDINTKENSAAVHGYLRIYFDYDFGISLKENCDIHIASSDLNFSSFSINPVNFKSITHKPTWLSITPDGEISITFEYSGVIRQKFDVAKFPFDTQIAEMSFSMDVSSEEYVLETETIFASSYGKYYTEWIPNTKSFTSSATDEMYSTIITKWEISRIPAHYIFKYFIPLLLLGFLSIFSFTLPDFTSALRVNGSVLFGLFSLNIAGANNLPKVGYLTFYDIIVLGEITINLLVIFMIFLWISEFKIGPLDFTRQSFRRKASIVIVLINALIFIFAMTLTGLL